ncbi:MAG: hypothetical protein Q4E07_05955 [Eubacteriales bacterium]|nr:hypothetical protein [Eubacteriales bacterium]
MDIKLFIQLYGVEKNRAATALHLSKSALNRKLRERSFTAGEHKKLFALCGNKKFNNAYPKKQNDNLKV